MFVRTVAAQSGFPFHARFLVDCSGCVLASAGSSSRCVCRRSSVLLNRFANFGWLHHLLVPVEIVCLVVGFCGGLLYGGFARAEQASPSGVER